MLNKTFCFFSILFIPFLAHAQQDQQQLDAYIKAVQNAYDNGSDSLDLYADKALPIAIKLGDINAEISVQRNRAIKYFLAGQAERAIQVLLTTARDAEKQPLTVQSAYLYYSIAQVYNKNNYENISEKYLRKGLDIAMSFKNDDALADGYNRMGILYENKPLLDSALYFYTESLHCNEKSRQFLGMAYSLENIAGIYALKNDLNAALSFQKRALTYKMQSGKKIDLAMSYINIAETFARLKLYDSCVHYTQKAMSIGKEINYKDLLRYSNQLLSGLYEQRRDYKKALEFHKKYSELNDTIYNETRTKQLAEFNTKYQTEKHEQRIKELSQQTTIQYLQLKQRNISLFIALGLLIVGAVIAYLVYNRQKFKEQARLQAEVNKQQAITVREVLNAEERERKRIAADLHDGVGQLMSATLINLDSMYKKLHIRRDADPLADRIFGLVTESYDELRSISHQMMPNALLKAGLGSAIKELISGIDNNRLAISFESVGLNERLSDEVETVLYRVIQESINNVIKHANATRLNLQIIKDEDGISVTIEDNGKGFDIKQIKQDGIGLKNMYSRVQFQNGSVDIDSQPGKGTLVAIHIPL